VIIVGIDEAGYGPLLGPLVVSATVFDVPDDKADASLWDLLRDCVTAEPRKRDPRLAIADSKKLKRGEDGLANLERAAMTCLMLAGPPPATLLDLLQVLSNGVLDAVKEYPWYGGLDVSLPRTCQPAELGTHANAMRRSLAAQGCRFVGALAEPLLEGHYNDMVTKTRNKSVVLLGLTLRLIMRVATIYPNESVRFHIDRQGGRTKYGRWLMTSFDGFGLKILEESSDRCAYRMHGASAEWRVEFTKKGEDHHLPIALASVFSKYVRELFMERFNAYWHKHVPDLKPTAGYYTDGKRFLADVDPHLERLGIDPAWLVRQL
jgi:hypothetical protein